MNKAATVDQYIAQQKPEIAERLQQIRDAFHQLAPDTQESIRYDMPAFLVGKTHLYMSAYAKHIGMYPMYGISNLDSDMLPYRGKNTKDALHFMHDQPLPIELIRKIILAKLEATER